MTEHLIIIVLSIFANYRLSRLISIDEITKPVRSLIGRKVTADKHNFWWWLAELINCPHCVGVWIAAVLAWFIAYSITEFVLLWLAIAGAQSFLQSLVGGSDE